MRLASRQFHDGAVRRRWRGVPALIQGTTQKKLPNPARASRWARTIRRVVIGARINYYTTHKSLRGVEGTGFGERRVPASSGRELGSHALRCAASEEAPTSITPHHLR